MIRIRHYCYPKQLSLVYIAYHVISDPRVIEQCAHYGYITEMSVQLTCIEQPKMTLISALSAQTYGYLIQYRRINVVRLLLKYGADVRYGFDNAMSCAIRLGDYDIVVILLNAGSNADRFVDVALYYGHRNIADLLFNWTVKSDPQRRAYLNGNYGYGVSL